MYRLKDKSMVLLFLIIMLGAFLRFYQLSKFPIQLNDDEISQLYEVISISQTGRDVYGNKLPVVFPLFGVYAPGHYIYLTSLLYPLLGNREVLIRLPAAIMGTLNIIAVFAFVKVIFKNQKLALLAAFLVAIIPSELFYSRKSFEYMTGNLFVFLGLTLAILFAEKKDNEASFLLRNKWWGIGATASLALSMYTYAAHTFNTPLLIAVYIASFWKKLARRKWYLAPALSGLLVALPLLYLTFTNEDLRFRANTIFITQDAQLGKTVSSIKMDTGIESMFLRSKVIFDYAFNRYLHQFSPTYIFANGLELTNQGLINMGPLYLWQLPFLIIGLAFIVNSSLQRERKIFLLALPLLSFIPGSLTFEDHSPHRSVIAFTFLSIISAIGLYSVAKTIIGLQQINNKIRILISSTLLIAFLVNFTFFINIYTVNFPTEKSQYIHYPMKEVSTFAWSEYDNFSQIIVDPWYGQTVPVMGVAVYYYLAYYGKYPPERFQKEYRTNELGATFGKFLIRKVDWPQDQNLINTLIISSSWNLPIDNISTEKILKTFYFYDGQPAYYAIKL